MRQSVVHRLGFLLIVGMQLSACGDDYEKGQLVLATYQQRAYAYPAVVTDIGDDDIKVRYVEDSSTETLPVAMIREFDWDEGSKIECAFQGGNTYYPGEIDDFDNPKMHFEYDDGNEEDTQIGNCRERVGGQPDNAQAAASQPVQDVRCLSSQMNCNGVCVDLMNDDNNCGACGEQCLNGKSCDGHGFCRDANGDL